MACPAQPLEVWERGRAGDKATVDATPALYRRKSWQRGVGLDGDDVVFSTIEQSAPPTLPSELRFAPS